MKKLKQGLPAILLFLFFSALYIYTAAPGVFSGDSGEIALTVKTLGVAHPTGFPLYIMTGKMFTLIFPVGDVAYRLNVYAALLIAGSIVFLYFALRNLDLSKTTAFITAAIFGFGRTIWFHAGVVSVYPLAVFFVVVLLFIFTKWQKSKNVKYIYWYAFIWSLSMGVHTLMLAMVIPLIFLIWQEKISNHNKNLKLGFVLLLVVLPFLQYIYLPIAYRHDAFHFDNVGSFAGFYHYITQRDYVGKMFFRAQSDFWPFVGQTLKTFWNELGPFFIFISVFGLVIFYRKNKILAWSFYLAAFFNIFMMYVYGNTPDLTILYRYLFVVYIVLSVGVGYALNLFLNIKNKWSFTITILVLAVGFFYQVKSSYALDNRRGHTVISDYARNLLAPLEPNSILITIGDSVSGPLWYLQSNGFREDVLVIDKGLLTLLWYRGQLIKKYPDLIDSSIMNVSASTQNELEAKLVYIIVEKNIGSHAIYKLTDHTDKDLASVYGMIPVGLENRVVKDISPETVVPLLDISATRLDGYSLPDKSLKYLDKDEKILADSYAVYLYNLGRMYYLFKYYDKAIIYFEKSSSWNLSSNSTLSDLTNQFLDLSKKKVGVN